MVGSVATVWDREITGMRLALGSLPVSPLLVLLYSRTAIAAVKCAAVGGHARIVDLRALVDLIRPCVDAGVDLRFGWVKAHMGNIGNERADDLAKSVCGVEGPMRVTERV